MSEFHVRVVKLEKIEKHPNADTLEMSLIDGGYPVVFKQGQYKEGDLAVYIPIDSIVPDTEEWAFLGGHRRIKAKRLRGIFSMGMLTPISSLVAKLPQLGPHLDIITGMSCQETMGITKWEPPAPGEPGVHFRSVNALPERPDMPKYTDIEGLRKHRGVLVPGEEVLITEKIHGANGRWMWDGEQFHVGSHNSMWKDTADNMWWRVLMEGELGRKIADAPGMVFYGEVYGNVQDLKYGLDKDVDVRIFDVRDSKTLRYLDVHEMAQLCDRLDIEMVNVLHTGPWDESLVSLAEGKTTIGGGHVREGFVVRPFVERRDVRCGRVILKMIGEGYMLRKEK